MSRIDGERQQIKGKARFYIRVVERFFRHETLILDHSLLS